MLKVAEDMALRQCSNEGGVNCVVGLWGANGHFAIARDSNGLYYAAFDGRLNRARRAALENCHTYGAGCKVVETLESMPYFLQTGRP